MIRQKVSADVSTFDPVSSDDTTFFHVINVYSEICPDSKSLSDIV